MGKSVSQIKKPHRQRASLASVTQCGICMFNRRAPLLHMVHSERRKASATRLWAVADATPITGDVFFVPCFRLILFAP
ncbi:hypothetical protein HanIR_Chr01g0034451 [Helianthus annuus]|nr:hypothetical protein HanIR_Chr01g0034451 [Helianthus annuus]